MSQQELTSYRLSSLQEPTDDMQHATTERVMANTMSVDEYFDELISQVHEDYA